MRHFLLIFLIFFPVFAFCYNKNFPGQKHLSDIINTDGTLKQNVNGSFDAKGFILWPGAGGKPVFKRTAEAKNLSNGWDNAASNGVKAPVSAIIVDGVNIYVAAGNVYKWNGSTWSVVGGGIYGGAYALAISGSNLYVGGQFTMAGNVAAKNIAMWNGTSWSALGTGMDSTVFSLAIFSNILYAGGSFITAGGIQAKYIARWNGSLWQPVGTGMNKDVRCLYPYGSDLYAGGIFTIAGSVSAKRIARWDGGTWSQLGTGMDSMVLSVSIHNGIVYAGGMFTTAGGVNALHVAQWNGTAWSKLAAGLNTGESYVSALVRDFDKIYVGYVRPSLTDGHTYSGIKVWNSGTNTWSSLGSLQDSLIDGYLNTLATYEFGNTIYAGGSLTKTGNTFALNIAKWSNGWSSLGSALNGDVAAIATNGNDIFLAGNFSSAGGLPADNIAKWNGSSWSGLGTNPMWGGFGGAYLRTVVVDGTDVYVGGEFSSIGGVATGNVAKWNGTSWSSLGTGTNAPVIALAVSNGNVYIGGFFNSAGGIPVNGLARWDGVSWSDMGAALPASPGIMSIVANGPDIYVGGYFTTAAGIAVNGIAKWNGTSWSALGAGLMGASPSVNALAFSGGNLYAAGYFTTSAALPQRHCVAKWDGSSWVMLGTGMNAPVLAISARGNEVFAGGYFTTADGNTTNYIARWNGTSWSALDSGVLGGYTTVGVAAIAATTSDLYVGGGFAIAGNKPAPSFSVYHNVTLPIICVDFNYRQRDKTILLSWTIARENNNDHFELQKSYDGVEFNSIAIIPSSGITSYEFTDNAYYQNNRSVYYRLKQVDRDGRFEFVCHTLKVAVRNTGTITAYPDPANSYIIVESKNINELQVTDISGKILMNRKVNDVRTILNLQHLANGTYIIRTVRNDGGIEIARFVKQ